MSKTIILVRQGKAEDQSTRANDKERPLEPEGIADSIKMATILSSLGIKPGMILTSSADRAVHTARIFLKHLDINEKNLTITRNLYYSPAKGILDQIAGSPDEIGCIMVVAHNPGISELARNLTSGRVIYMGNTQMVIAEYELDNWNQLGEHKPVSFKSFRPDGKVLLS